MIKSWSFNGLPVCRAEMVPAANCTKSSGRCLSRSNGGARGCGDAPPKPRARGDPRHSSVAPRTFNVWRPLCLPRCSAAPPVVTWSPSACRRTPACSFTSARPAERFFAPRRGTAACSARLGRCRVLRFRQVATAAACLAKTPARAIRAVAARSAEALPLRRVASVNCSPSVTAQRTRGWAAR